MKPALVAQLVELGDSVTKFRNLFSQYWIYVRAIVISTRTYDEGLVVVDRLEKLNEIYKKDNYLDETEYKEFQKDLFLFKLELLDKADAWNDFLHFFEEKLKDKNVHTLTYDPGLVDLKSPYLVKVDNQYAYIHPLYWLDYRYQIIKRKIERSSKSKKIKNLQHKPKSDLTDEEIQNRFSTIMKAAEEGRPVNFSGYY